jgi:hypothetical protein
VSRTADGHSAVRALTSGQVPAEVSGVLEDGPAQSAERRTAPPDLGKGLEPDGSTEQPVALAPHHERNEPDALGKAPHTRLSLGHVCHDTASAVTPRRANQRFEEGRHDA